MAILLEFNSDVDTSMNDPGDTFKVIEKDKLIKFTNYEKFEFNQNKIQIFSNFISIISLIGGLLYLLVFCIRNLIK